MSTFRSRAVSRILRRRHHDAEVDHLVVVALEDDADDVLADVVDVALDGGEQDACRRCSVPGRRAARFSSSMNGIR